jgi:hypothetical protein
MRFLVERVDLGEANAFVARHHRHHRPVVGHHSTMKFAALQLSEGRLPV